MIVGKAYISEIELQHNVKSAEEFIKFCDNLVPKEFRGCKGIVNNQRYLCCLYLRKCKSVSWDVKKEILNTVMPQISVIGYINNLVEVNTLYSHVDMGKVNKYVKEVIKSGI